VRCVVALHFQRRLPTHTPDHNDNITTDSTTCINIKPIIVNGHASIDCARSKTRFRHISEDLRSTTQTLDDRHILSIVSTFRIHRTPESLAQDIRTLLNKKKSSRQNLNSDSKLEERASDAQETWQSPMEPPTKLPTATQQQPIAHPQHLLSQS
jgi:hypothetical protein